MSILEWFPYSSYYLLIEYAVLSGIIHVIVSVRILLQVALCIFSSNFYICFLKTWSKFRSIVDILWKRGTAVGALSADHLKAGLSWTIKTVRGLTYILTRQGFELGGSCRILML